MKIVPGVPGKGPGRSGASASTGMNQAETELRSAVQHNSVYLTICWIASYVKRNDLTY